MGGLIVDQEGREAQAGINTQIESRAQHMTIT